MISNSIVAAVVSSTFMGVLLLWADEKLKILVPMQTSADRIEQGEGHA
jgi:hypothetical protein